MKGSVSFSLISILLLVSGILIVTVCGEVDKTSTVTRVIDGDTFDISTGEIIRLADVDAPEYYESGYSEAKDYLSGLIDGKTVYLDIDDIYTYDYSGSGSRLVCVVYVDYDLTYLLNVNKALLDDGYAEVSNYYNEFNPYSWSLLVPKDGDSEPTPTPGPYFEPSEEIEVVIAILAVISIIAILVMINKSGKNK